VTKPSKQVDLALMLLEYIQRRDGIVTSPRGAWPIRFETTPESSLPANLINLGHALTLVGESERNTPHAHVETWIDAKGKEQVNRQAGIVTMHAYSIALPKD
jgi:hypothetical protein